MRAFRDQAAETGQGDSKAGLNRTRPTPLRFLGGGFGFLILTAVMLSALFYLIASAGSFTKSGELEAATQRLEHEIKVLEDENRLLRQQYERIQTDPAYIEDEARKKLGLVRPSEVIYRLSEEPDLSDAPLPAALGKRLEIKVTGQGDIYFEDQLTAMPNLPRHLIRAGAAGGEAVIVINADQSAAPGQIVKIIDTLRQEGFNRVVLSTHREASKDGDAI